MQNLLLLLERFFSTLLTIDYLKVIYNEGDRHHTTTKLITQLQINFTMLSNT